LLIGFSEMWSANLCEAIRKSLNPSDNRLRNSLTLLRRKFSALVKNLKSGFPDFVRQY